MQGKYLLSIGSIKVTALDTPASNLNLCQHDLLLEFFSMEFGLRLSSHKRSNLQPRKALGKSNSIVRD